MSDIFSPTAGIGMSWLRVPMGSSDFSATAQPYSYYDLPAGRTDPSLAHFSITHDLAYIVPDVKQASALNPKLKILANPWSPPGWMKTNGKMNNRGNKAELLPADYQALANYFVKFILSTRNWSKVDTMWNIAENQNNGPILPGGCTACDPLLRINDTTHTIRKLNDFYTVGQFSKFVGPGAHRIASTTTTTNTIDDVAFRNPDGTDVLVAHNTSSIDTTFSTSINGVAFTAPPPAGSTATFTWTR